MSQQLDELLSQAVNAWVNPVDWAALYGTWRGNQDLQEFASSFPTTSAQTSQQPSCVVLAEYGRWALSNQGPSAAINHLRQECKRTLAVQPASPASDLVHAITNTVLAAVEYRANQIDKACEALARGARCYDSAWLISRQFTATTLANSSPAAVGEDPSIADPALRFLDLATRRGAFGANGVSISTWLTLRTLLAWVLGGRQPAVICSNDLKALTVRGDQLGRVLRLGVDKLQLEGVTFAAFLDPFSFGITTLDKRMRISLWLAARCCQQVVELADDVAIRLRLDCDLMTPMLGGASAGGLFAAGMIASAQELPLYGNKSTSCILTISKNSRDRDPTLLTDELRPIPIEDFQLRPIRGVVNKLDEAWKIEHGIDQFFLHPTNERQWQQAHPGCDTPKVTPVDSLTSLLNGLWGERRFDREIKRHADAVHERWIKASKADAKGRDAIERDHRFECYVPPTLRIEGDLRWTDFEAAVAEAPRAQMREAGQRREEFSVPGTGDDQLLNLLGFALRAEPWQDAPVWLAPGRELVIYDVAGAGKTVCSHRICHFVSDPNNYVRLMGRDVPPLVIRLDGRWRREFDTEGRLLTIAEMLQKVFAEEAERKSVEHHALVCETVEHALREKRVLLILDGFDQFHPEDRAHVVDKFRNDPHARECRWIITSRVHTIDEHRDGHKFFSDKEWIRVRIDLFSEDQQDAYFGLVTAGGKAIGDRWLEMVDRPAMSELLSLPMVLWMIRILIEDADRLSQPLPVFYSLSQLYVVTSRKLLARALELNKVEVEKRLLERKIDRPYFKNWADQLELLEQVLTLMAFQMMLIEEYNGRRDGKEQVTRFEKMCRDRFLHDLKKRFEAADEFDKDDVRAERTIAVSQWNWAVEVLRTIELSHRSVTEAYHQAGLVFRSRKMLECHAARYLTRYATAWDILATDDVADMPIVDPSDDSPDLLRLCAWNYTTHPDWQDTWKLAIEMPQEPITTTDRDGVYALAVIDHGVTCRSLSVLFRRPKAYVARDIRPTRLIYRAWHLFEFDDRLLRERRFAVGGRLVPGDELSDEVRQRLGNSLLLGVNTGSQAVVLQREKVLEIFRESSRPLVAEFEKRFDTILVDGQRMPIPADKKTRDKLLEKWRAQSAREKSLTFIQCPPQNWIDAYESLPEDQRLAATDPRINDAIEGLASSPIRPFRIATTTVTRAQYAVFDSALERTQQNADYPSSPIADVIIARASAFGRHRDNGEFPILCTDWFDAWSFCKWLGREYRLPHDDDWEHACRAGTKTEYHFGDGLNGEQANCDGAQPYGNDERGHKLKPGPDLGRTTPVGLAEYPCNDYGLFDLHGNIWEWCENLLDEEGSFRVYRGGCWYDAAWYCRSGFRDGFSPGFRYGYLGFRVALVPSSKTS